jgi:hypothetical protein
VHREEVDARADLLLGQQALVVVARPARRRGVDADDIEVERVRVARIARERLDSGQGGHGRVVGRDVTLANRPVTLDLVQLDERDRREHIREVRLVARNRNVVQRAVAAAHDAQVVDGRGDVVAVRGHQAPLAGGNVLRRVEREAGRSGEPTELAPAIRSLDGVGRVLDDRGAELPQRLEVARLPREVDGQDRLRPAGDRLSRALGVEVQVVGADVGEDGARAAVDDHVRGCRPGDRARDDLVAGAHSECDEREMECCRPRREREHVLRLEVLGEPPLQLGGAGAGGEPARANGLGDRLDLLLAHGRGLEAEERLPRGQLLHRRCRSVCARLRRPH